MDQTSEFQAYRKLKEELNFHSYRYHVLDSPLISDYEYDQKYQQLLAFEQAHPDWISSDSPSQRSGVGLLDKFTKVQHPSPILSLANAFNNADVVAWFERISKIDDRVLSTDFIVEPKIDGLTVVLHYENGFFKLGTTRGDGLIGEDITQNLRTVKSLPLHIPVDPLGPRPPIKLVVRGEAYLSIDDFRQLNQRLQESGEKTYLNPRNTAAGSLRQLDPALTATRPLKLLVYQIVLASDGDIPTTQWELLAYLKSLGFPVTNHADYCDSLQRAMDICSGWVERRDSLPYEADGMVIKINNLILANDLGVVGKDPRGAIALKFPAQEVTTRLKDIVINVGRTGVLTPAAQLEPVEVGGVIVRQATLHNFDYIWDKDIRIGDRVLLKRAGDVIPYVIGPVVEVRDGSEIKFTTPNHCPACGQLVEHIEGEVAWFCVNSACPAQLIRNLEHFVSRGAMDIVGLGIKIVQQLVSAGLVKDVADLYGLKNNDLLKLDGFAEKKADNLIASIATSREKPLARLIFALGIQGVGEVLARNLANVYTDLEELENATFLELQTMEGVGPNIAQSIVDWFKQPANRQIISKLKKAGVWPEEKKMTAPSASQPLQGLTIAVTGTLRGFTRESVKEFILQNGGKVTDSVSKNTHFLVAGEGAGSKLEKAKTLGVKIISEDELRSLIASK